MSTEPNKGMELTAPPSPYQMMLAGTTSGLTPETLEKMLELQQKYDAIQAKKAYTVAIAAFKTEAPSVIAKDGSVSFDTRTGKTSYKHATLGGIVRQITSALSNNGLSISWEIQQEGPAVQVTCHLAHVAGHRESVSLYAPPDNSGGKNIIQQIASTVAYLERYTLLAITGLATAEDTDGIPAHGAPAEISADDAVQRAKVVTAEVSIPDASTCPVGGEGFTGVKWTEFDNETLEAALLHSNDAITHAHRAAIRLVLEQRKEGAK
jgi:hypothetical protein